LCSRVFTAPAGDLGVAEAAEVEQGDGRALAGRQRGDGSTHALGDRRRLGRLVGPGVVRRALDAVEARPARPVLQRAAAEVQAYADQPGGEAVVAAQALEPEQRGDDRLLRGVGGRFRVAGCAAAGGEQQRVVAFGERGEGATVAVASGGDEGRVASSHARVPGAGWRGAASARPWLRTRTRPARR
jgi:hypothetical protein